MKRGTTRRSAVVGDRRPLERNLARFLLEERGFAVAAEAATAADTVRAVAEHRPDVVLVHEDVATEQGASIIPGIRSSSSKTRIIVLTSDRAAADPVLVAAADAVVEEGPGLKELESALSAGRVRAVPARSVAGPIAFAAASTSPRPGFRERGWVERLQGAAAASIIVLAVVLARGIGPGAPGGGLSGPARVHLVAAQQALQTLQEQLSDVSDADSAEVASLARTLLVERAAAVAAGADVSALDAAIAETLGPLMESLPTDVQNALLQILGDLLTGGSPPPPPSPEPGPSGEPEPTPQPGPETTKTPSPEPSHSEQPSPVETVTESPSPTETETETPSPTETESPSPTETETPSPTETETPSPTETETPSPTETETPSPTETETPSPTETETPSPTETESPSPTETETPSPTETETPSPTCAGGGAAPAHDCDPPSPSPCDDDGIAHHCDSDEGAASAGSAMAGTLYVVPPGLVLLVATSGLARRFIRRRGRAR